MATDPGDLVLDPTCGSGTTAYVAEQWGRRWITCDTSRVALALARTRLMAAKYPYYYLAGDYPQMVQMNTDEEIKDYLRKSAKSAESAEKIVVEIKGLDMYDPTTGQIRNSSTDDIACWFIDTDYNGESFFVRHAYFTGAEEPYEKLKRALRAEIDEAAWSALYSTTSRSFDPPKTGKIAVKVINHYGDEVLKVFEV
jgi:SAM-dependent methyltransferase